MQLRYLRKNQQMFGKLFRETKPVKTYNHASITRENVRRGCDPRQPAGKLKAQHGNFGMLQGCDGV